MELRSINLVQKKGVRHIDSGNKAVEKRLDY